MTTRKLACTSKEQFYDFSFFIIFHTQYLHKICIFLLLLAVSFFFILYIYCINTLRKKKKCTIIFFLFFVVQLFNTQQKITAEKMHRRLACSTNKIQMHTVLFCFRMEWMKFPVIKKNAEWKKSNKKWKNEKILSKI